MFVHPLLDGALGRRAREKQKLHTQTHNRFLPRMPVVGLCLTSLVVMDSRHLSQPHTILVILAVFLLAHPSVCLGLALLLLVLLLLLLLLLALLWPSLLKFACGDLE